MIHPTRLKDDLQKQVTLLEKDLHARLKAEEAFKTPLKAHYDEAFASKRTAVTFIAWAEDRITQSAVAWVLATVFIRFLEDNGLLPDPILSGPGGRRGLAQDALSHYFMQEAGASERDYLLHHFGLLRQYPAMAELLGPRNALHALHPTPDALKVLIAFWREIDPGSGELRHDFTDLLLDTRFLGDLYQDLSAAARKTYALLQTPLFIEEFILDRTLTPAIREFGFRIVRLIDPTCGSGHFLLGAFRRLFTLWEKEVSTTREAAVNALNGVFGVDLNPFAIAISRFRLIIAACQACGVRRLVDAPDFAVNVTVGDSLLHGRRFREWEEENVSQPTLPGSDNAAFRDELKHHYEVEDVEALHRILGQQYHAVVGNPPYITVKDRAVSEAYRARYPSCHRKYSLSVPFMERFFDLAVKGDDTPQQPAGFVGQITANSFMKREFGKKLIEEYLPRWDLTHVIDTDKAHIPGHATGTAILLGKNQPPVSSVIRTVMGIKKQEPKPQNAEQGLAWLAICSQVDSASSQTEWVSTADFPRTNFHRHPWSIGGGGAAELKEFFDEAREEVLGSLIASSGFGSIVGEDDAFTFPLNSLPARAFPQSARRPFVEGDTIRDWALIPDLECLFPYDSDITLLRDARIFRGLWPLQAVLEARSDFSKRTYKECGRPYWEYHQIPVERNRARARIAFAFVATHNQFVFDIGSKVFKQSAPIINLPRETSELAHVQLIGVLNSSSACFWMKQSMQDKGGGGIGGGISAEMWEHRFEFDSTKLRRFPIPSSLPTQLPTALVQTSTALQAQSPAATLASWSGPQSGELRTRLDSARDEAARLRGQLIAWQEELDWQIYRAYGLIEEDDQLEWPEDRMEELPPLQLGERTFEIWMARQMARGILTTTWFERHSKSGSRPITEPPLHWPADYLALYHRRHAAIQDNPNLRLIEQPEYKRRWNTEPWDEQFQTAARDWLLARLETYAFDSERMEGAAATAALRQSWSAGLEPKCFTLAQLVAVAQSDAALMMVMQEYTGTPAFDLTRQIRTLLEEGSVPFLPSQRYKETGLRKRQAWEETWALQRKEDAVEQAVRSQQSEDSGRKSAVSELELTAEIRKQQKEQVGDIPVPPKYAKTDFKKDGWWKLRGKLDVPKERWVSYPGLETPTAPSPLFAWAGWTHLQQAKALAALYVERKDRDGWDAQQLTPLLAGLQELVPWLQQWHNEEDPEFGLKLGDYFAGFLEEERRALGLTAEAIEQVRLG